MSAQTSTESGLAGWLALTTAALLCLAFVSGCGAPDKLRNLLRGGSDETTAVRIGDREYSRAELDLFFDNRLSEFRDPAEADKVKSNLLEVFIEEKMLLAQAERHQIEPDPESLNAVLSRITDPAEERATGTPQAARDSELRKSISENLKVQRYVQDYLLKNVAISEEECEAYYREHMSDFVRKDVVRLREILVEDPHEAQKIQSLLSASRNKNFGELARLYSKAPTAANGGVLGTFERGDLPQEFERVVFSLSPGTAGRVVRTKYGYHIFLVEERISAHQQKFWEVKDEISERLLLEREREVLDRELETLIKQTPVEVLADRLDFKYTGNRFDRKLAK